MGGRFEVVKFDCIEGVDYNSGVSVSATLSLDYTEDLTIEVDYIEVLLYYFSLFIFSAVNEHGPCSTQRQVFTLTGYPISAPLVPPAIFGNFDDIPPLHVEYGGM